MAEKETLVAIVGPTAVGKTKAGVVLAKHFHGEVISGDSMQVYKGLDIGTAKVTEKEMDGIPHHLIDVKDPSEPFTVAEFQKLAIPIVSELNRNGKIPFLVGGTGLYVRALTRHFSFAESPSDPDFREKMESLLEQKGPRVLYNRLMAIDPKRAKTIHPNNTRRVIRALEVHHVTGQKMKAFDDNHHDRSPYHLVMIGLTMERSLLYERINARCDEMIAKGLVEEVAKLKERGLSHCQAAQGIGYKEIIEYLDGHISFLEAVRKLKRNSRRYAKRQLTWFRNKEKVKWFDIGEGSVDEVFAKMISYVEGKLKDPSNTYRINITEGD